ncbi:hypothetical protein RIF29_16898 [Crotalaria pallida]|uniref:Uncharacterized protein n=1 Tax=Crotalaria pallida TaxID=3830 RepID=A0AAN9FJM5_CROPI
MVSVSVDQNSDASATTTRHRGWSVAWHRNQISLDVASASLLGTSAQGSCCLLKFVASSLLLLNRRIIIEERWVSDALLFGFSHELGEPLSLTMPLEEYRVPCFCFAQTLFSDRVSSVSSMALKNGVSLSLLRLNDFMILSLCKAFLSLGKAF